MPEETNSPENPTPPEEPTELAEAEWSDDSAYEALEEHPGTADATGTQAHGDENNDAALASEVSRATADTTTATTTAAETTEAEWSDDSAYESLESAPTAAAPANDAATTEEWDEATFEWDEELSETPAAPPAPPTTQDALSWLKPAGRRFRRVWQRLLTGVRNRVPTVADFPDAVLSAIIIGTLVLLLIVLNTVRQPAVASSPTHPSAALEKTASPTVGLPNSGAVEDEPGPAAPDAPSMPSEPAPVIVDGDRIAKIQSQLTDSSILNAQRVVDSVQADFQRNQLTLILNGDWYRLSDYDQTQLTQALMQQSQDLEFEEIQCLTPAGELLARSPVVGSNMVILQRERPPEVPEPERPRFRILVDR
ncbi:hypothetical protein [Halomicronema sp. CCY15110]|uniref:hypothetical protein n=1 Tax=Halomicronema sp. CCY15110 TaxID=2767773 RepID=UPI00194F555E|nr:hypothetical protein [Halomicronema sp. CCY15110]